tara:strand:+ start:842 stop:1252 length:411 start_codon:yes stop_codon:yes gene_type:complete
MASGLIIALLGTLLAYHAPMTSNFYLFLVGALLIGFNAAFTQQGRFIIMKHSATPDKLADGITLALMANLFAAIVGPMMGAYGKDMIESPAGFAGSFILSGSILVLALLVLTLLTNTVIAQALETKIKRSLQEIAK